MSKRPITSIDVANLAGVSQATVSRVLSGSERVTKETRQKVLNASTQLGYHPNALARGLITQHTQIVSLVVGNIDSPFYSSVVDKLTLSLQELGLQVLLFNSSIQRDPDDILPQVLQYRVSAFIITAATLSSDMANQCAQTGAPVILFNRVVFNAPVSAVWCDNVEGGRIAANYLVDRGYKRLAYIAGRLDSPTNADREKGYFERLRERGFMDQLKEQGAYSYDSGRQAALRLLQMDSPPDAIFCADDSMAMGAMDAVRFDCGLRVPHDVAILGFDDVPAASWPTYSLSSIRQPVDRMVAETIALLQLQLQNPEAGPQLKIMPVELVERNSTKC